MKLKDLDLYAKIALARKTVYRETLLALVTENKMAIDYQIANNASTSKEIAQLLFYRYEGDEDCYAQDILKKLTEKISHGLHENLRSLYQSDLKLIAKNTKSVKILRYIVESDSGEKEYEYRDAINVAKNNEHYKPLKNYIVFTQLDNSYPNVHLEKIKAESRQNVCEILNLEQKRCLGIYEESEIQELLKQ